MLFDEFRGFQDRQAAGRELASRLQGYAGRKDVVVLALPRGGVPVAHEVAEALGAKLDVFVVRKLGTPGHRELAMGAIASGGVRVLNDEVIRSYGVSGKMLEDVTTKEQIELERREQAYREGRPAVGLADRVAILVDDGVATGASMLAAVKAVRQHRPSKVVVAVPVGAPDTCALLGDVSDDVVCARTPQSFSAVGEWYLSFEQVSDDEVRRLLRAHALLTSASR